MTRNYIVAFWKESAGQDAVEYGLLLGFLVLSTAGALLALRGAISVLWTSMNTLLSTPG